jgi:hypothetical protein
MVAVASPPMRRAFAWMTGLVGVAALARLLRRRQVEKPAETSIEDPAAELRETLARSRSPETPTDAPSREPEEPPATSLEERRARVHARAQEAIESMRQAPEDPS